MKTTRYFDEQVVRKRPYINAVWCATVISAPIRTAVQPNGRIRFWGDVVDPRDGKTRFLRVVTLADGATVLNAFFDRNFKVKRP